jgi:hypothetical protein
MNEVQLLILGALLAIVGGVMGDEIRSWLARSRERKAIKISLCDELGEIEAIIHSIHTVWESAKVFTPNYVADLLSSTTAYDGLRTRLFLIKEDTTRTSLNSFYKKLRDTVRKTEGKIGTLADTPEATAEQGYFDAAFQSLGTDAKELREKLKP